MKFNINHFLKHLRIVVINHDIVRYNCGNHSAPFAASFPTSSGLCFVARFSLSPDNQSLTRDPSKISNLLTRSPIITRLRSSSWGNILQTDEFWLSLGTVYLALVIVRAASIPLPGWHVPPSPTNVVAFFRHLTAGLGSIHGSLELPH